MVYVNETRKPFVFFCCPPGMIFILFRFHNTHFINVYTCTLHTNFQFQFNSVITVTIRSQCTKEVDKSEIGRIFSVVGLGQAIVPLIANPLFGLIYKATLQTLPGAYLLTIVGMLVFVFITSFIMTVQTFRQ